MDLLELYTAIVESAGWNVNSEGFVTAFKGPVEIAGKQMVMPTKKILRNPDWDNHIAFHPMSENVMRGESAVLFELRNQMQFKLKEAPLDFALCDSLWSLERLIVGYDIFTLVSL